MDNRVYNVYIKNRKKFSGTKLAILLKYNINKCVFDKVVQGLQDKMNIGTGENKQLVNVKIVPVKEKLNYKGSNMFDCVMRHLDEYGNTILMKKHKDVLDELKKNKVKVNIREGVYSNAYWVLEVPNEK